MLVTLDKGNFFYYLEHKRHKYTATFSICLHFFEKYIKKNYKNKKKHFVFYRQKLAIFFIKYIYSNTHLHTLLCQIM